jgi:hypothetical protein
LNHDLEQLKINEQAICPEDVAMARLSKKYGLKKADRYLGFLVRNQGLSKEEMAASYKESLHTINRNMKAITDAEVCWALSENEKTFPNLTVDYSNQIPPK